MKIKFAFLISILCLSYSVALAQTELQNRWEITPDNVIKWSISSNALPHYDHIEMSGTKVSYVLRYAVNENSELKIERSVIWPMLRTVPNNTHASLMQRFGIDIPSLLLVNGLSIQSQEISSITHNGIMTVVGKYGLGFNDEPSRKIYSTVEIKSSFFPSVDKPMVCETYELKNVLNRHITVVVPALRNEYKTLKSAGVQGSYTIVNSIQGSGCFVVEPAKTISFGSTIQAFSDTQKEETVSVQNEYKKRESFVTEISTKLELVTPDSVLNTAFKFAKIRASESIFDTKGGLMHGPGGESYYAAIWANDQAEYINPFFPFLGYETGNLSAMNSYRHFARFMNPEYKPIPSSIIAEGDDIWNGAGDRGDAAMIAYGASRYALTSGSVEESKELWPLIEWCLEYCDRKINEDGVVASNTDELEGRFPAGDANLSTSSLYYDALISATYLVKNLRLDNSLAKKYSAQAKALKKNINDFFGANVEGFDTYRYYKENDLLRSWICMPLTVGIFEKSKGTIDALFSTKLWTKDGLLTQSGSKTFWDRSTLYALRGVFAAGETQKAIEFLQYYSNKRLLGEHVPYPIEAWPEGSQRHLSAESALYCRIFTEGLFGIRPTGFNSFEITARIPQDWNQMELKNVMAFNRQFDIKLVRNKSKVRILLMADGKTFYSKSVKSGATINVKL